MPRKLKTYATSLGFYDQAGRRPAVQDWGASSNLFHQVAANGSDDPDIVAGGSLTWSQGKRHHLLGRHSGPNIGGYYAPS